MPFAFIIVGLVLVASGVKGTSSQLLTLLKGDFQGTDGYLYWLISILLIGSLGYVPSLKPFSRAFLILVLVVLVLREGKSTNSGGGFFAQFTSALKQISQPATSTTTTPATPSVSATVPTISVD